MKTTLLSALLVSAVAAAPKHERRAGTNGYEGYKVLRMETGDQLDQVKDMLSAFQYDEWTHDASNHIDFSISPEQVSQLKALGASFKEIHVDLGMDIAYESKPCGYKGKNQTGALPDLSWFDGYHPFQDHLDYLDDLADAFNNSETFVSGKSLEGREQKGIHFWGKHGKGKNKAILWHGTTHAREWISAMTVEYLAYQLIAGYGKDALVTSFVDDYDFYLIPFVNPDGFVYTQTNDRLWRKNRQPPLPGANQSCWGVDLNRNWPHEWDTNPEGSSNNSCSQTYRGEYPASEPEMAGMAGFADKLAESQGLKLFIDWHSYGQLLLTPYGFSCDTFPETNAEHIALMNATAKGIASVHGTNYTVGPGCETLYPTNGASYDYTYDISGAEWASLIELRDEGEFGFVLPPEQILPNCEEIWAGMQVLLARV